LSAKIATLDGGGDCAGGACPWRTKYKTTRVESIRAVISASETDIFGAGKPIKLHPNCAGHDSVLTIPDARSWTLKSHTSASAI